MTATSHTPIAFAAMLVARSLGVAAGIGAALLAVASIWSV